MHQAYLNWLYSVHLHTLLHILHADWPVDVIIHVPLHIPAEDTCPFLRQRLGQLHAIAGVRQL